MRSVLRRTARILAVVVAVVLLPVGFAAVSAPAALGGHYAPGPDRIIPAVAPAPHDPNES
jgi:autotransporter translocation and assembly factor TamB